MYVDLAAFLRSLGVPADLKSADMPVFFTVLEKFCGLAIID